MSKTASTGQLLDLAGQLVNLTPKNLSPEVAEFWQQHPKELKRAIKRMLRGKPAPQPTHQAVRLCASRYEPFSVFEFLKDKCHVVASDKLIKEIALKYEGRVPLACDLAEDVEVHLVDLQEEGEFAESDILEQLTEQGYVPASRVHIMNLMTQGLRHVHDGMLVLSVEPHQGELMGVTVERDSTGAGNPSLYRTQMMFQIIPVGERFRMNGETCHVGGEWYKTIRIAAVKAAKRS